MKTNISFNASKGTTAALGTTSVVITIIQYVISVIAKLFVGAIVFYALAHFVPEIREVIPSVYRLVDWLMGALEWVYSLFWRIFDK